MPLRFPGANRKKKETWIKISAETEFFTEYPENRVLFTPLPWTPEKTT